MTVVYHLRFPTNKLNNRGDVVKEVVQPHKPKYNDYIYARECGDLKRFRIDSVIYDIDNEKFYCETIEQK